MIEAQILYGRLKAIVAELAENIRRTAHSDGLTKQSNFATAVLDGDQRLIAQTQFGPQHIFAVRDTARRMLDYFAFSIEDGDILICSDPFNGGTTPQYLTVIAPVMHEGELVLLPAARALMADLAGEYPGNLHPLAFETWQEAVRYTPLKLYRHGVLQRDTLNFVLRNSRAQKLVEADLAAIVASLRRAGKSIGSLLTAYRTQAVRAACDSVIAYSGKMVAAHLQDSFGALEKTVSTTLWTESGPVPIALRVAVRGGRLIVDAGGTGRNPKGPYNMTLGHAKGYALVAVAAELLDEITLNEGVLDLVEFHADKGCIFDADLPMATGLSDMLTAHVLVDEIRKLVGLEDSLSGPAPLAALFEVIGAEFNPSVALDPAFAVSAQGWGHPMLAGRCSMPSAEESQTSSNFTILSREFVEDGSIRALVRARGDAAGEGNFFVGRGADGRPIGSIAIGIDAALTPVASSVAVSIPPGSLIEIIYPAYGAPRDS